MASTKLKPFDRKKIIQHILLEKYPDFDPVIAMVEMVHEDEINPNLKFQCLKEVAQYIYPKLKSMEVKVEDETPTRYSGAVLNVVRKDPDVD